MIVHCKLVSLSDLMDYECDVDTFFLFFVESVAERWELEEEVLARRPVQP